MSEVKRYSWHEDGMYSHSFGGRFVRSKDFDRVTAERDAALAENKLLRHDVSSYLETVAKVCDMLGVDLESAKTAEGKPSDVLFGYASSMQQRLTAADERVDFLLDVAISLTIQAHAAIGNTEHHEDCIRDLAALKPAEGGGDEYRKSCEVAHKALSLENQRIKPVRFKCLACGEYHEGCGNLPCPSMSPYSRIEQ